MATDIERLIELIVDDISCYGDFGCSVSHVLSVVDNLSGSATHGGAGYGGTQVQAEDHSPNQALWDWLRARKDVSIGEDRQYNSLHLSDVLVLPEAPVIDNEFDTAAAQGDAAKKHATDAAESVTAKPSGKQKNAVTTQYRPKVYVSPERMWQSLAGHGADFKRVPRLEWAALVGIASTKREGILQGDLCRLTGQDKRSLPKRTDALATKGYIVKRTTLARGVKTSKMWLRRLAPSLPVDPTSALLGKPVKPTTVNANLSAEALNRDMEPVAWRARWTGNAIDIYSLAETAIAIVKAYGIIRYHDLRRKLGILTLPWQMKTTARLCRWMVRRGIIQYVGATLGDRLYKDCLKYIRDFTSDDWVDYLRTGKEKSKPKLDTNFDAYKDETHGEAAMATESNRKGRKRVNLQATWKPEKPLTSTVLDTIRAGDAKGVTNRYIGSQTIGPPFIRYVTSISTTLATPSLQPEHLAHFQVAKSLERVKKQAVYLFSLPKLSKTGDLDEADTVPAMSQRTRGHLNSLFAPAAQDQVYQESGGLRVGSRLPALRRQQKTTERETKTSTALGNSNISVAEERIVEQETAPLEVLRSSPERDSGDMVTSAESKPQATDLPAVGPVVSVQREARRSRRGRQPPTLIVSIRVGPDRLRAVLVTDKSHPPSKHAPQEPTDDHEGRNTSKPPGTRDRLSITVAMRQSEDNQQVDSAFELANQAGDPEQPEIGSLQQRDGPDSPAVTTKHETCLGDDNQESDVPNAIADLTPATSPHPTNQPSHYTGPQRSKNGKKLGIWRCDKCGRIWKNDNGLKYHLEKSSSSCNPNYVQPPPRTPSMFPRRTPSSVKDNNESLILDSPRRPRRAATSARASLVESPTSDTKHLRKSASFQHAPALRPRAVHRRSVMISNELSISPGQADGLDTEKIYNKPTARQAITSLAKAREDDHMSSRFHGGLIGVSVRARDMTYEMPSLQDRSQSRKQSLDGSQQHLAEHVGRRGRAEKETFSRNDLEGTFPLPGPPFTNHPKHPLHAETKVASNSVYDGTVRAPPQTRDVEPPGLTELQPNVDPSLSLIEPFRPPVDSEKPGPIGYRNNSQLHRASEIVQYLIRANGGVFPSDRSLWYGVYSVWEKTFPHDSAPNHSSCQLVVTKLAEKKMLVKSTHAFRDARGLFRYVTILLAPGVDPTSTPAVMLKDRMIEEYPRPYIQPGFMPTSGMPDDSTWNGKPIFSHRRKLAKDIEVLDAPFYASRKIGKRKSDTQAEDYPEGANRRKRQRTTPGRFRNSHFVRQTDLDDAGYKRTVEDAEHDFNLDPSLALGLVQVNAQPALTFLEPNTHLDDEDEDDLELIDPVLKQLSGGFGAGIFVPGKSRKHQEKFSAVRFADIVMITDHEGEWPALLEKFFERGCSFALQGWMPSSRWFLGESLPRSISELMSWSGQSLEKRQPESYLGAFKRQVKACSQWELAPETIKEVANLGSVAPNYYWINLEMTMPLPLKWENQGLIWQAEDQKTAIDYLRGWPGYSPSKRRGDTRDGFPGTKRLRRDSLSYQLRTLDDFAMQMDLKTRTLTPWSRAPILAQEPAQKRQLDGSNDSVLLAAFIATRTLLGGADKYVEWGLMTQLFPDKSLAFLRKFWSRARKDRVASINQLTERFHKRFIAAYERRELEPLDFDNYLEYDWVKLIEWTLGLVGERVTLPATRSALQQEYVVETAQADVNDWQDEYYSIQASMFSRLEALTSRPAAVPADRVYAASQDTDLELVKAKSWMRALCGTAHNSYHPSDVRDRMASITDKGEAHNNALLERAIESLQIQNVITKTKQRRLEPRSHRLTEWFLPRLVKASHEQKFLDAAAFKSSLDNTFRQEQTYRIPYVLRDGEVVAMINLQASGRIHISPIDVPQIPLGFKPGFYESRKFPKSFYNFGLEIAPTDTYQYDDGLDVLTRAMNQAPPSQNLEGALPLWSDIFGTIIRDRWAVVLAAVVFIIAMRGPLDVLGVRLALKPYLEEFEIKLVIDWSLRNGAVEKTAHGDHYTVGEWWWLIVGQQRSAAGLANPVSGLERSADSGNAGVPMTEGS